MDSVATERAELEKALDEIDRQLRAVRERLMDPGFRESAKPAQRAEQERLQDQLRARRQRVETNLVTLLQRRPGGLPAANAGTWRPLLMHQQEMVEPPQALTRAADQPPEVWHSQLSLHIAEILRSGESETRQIQALKKCVELAEEHVPTLQLILAALEGFPLPELGQDLRLLLARLTGSEPPALPPLAVETIPLSPMPEADALPDPRDGLTRMERLVLCAMWAGKFRYRETPKQTATLVDELRKGDTTITAERVHATLTQLMHPWSEKHPLVVRVDDFWGLTELGEALFLELEFATDLDPAFPFKAPRILPVQVPLLLAKGTDGVPPHDLGELLSLAIKKFEGSERVSLKSFAGPDFPTGGALCGFPFGLYDWGRDQVVIRGRTAWEHEQTSSRARVVISELPWPLRTSEVIAQLEKLPGVVSAVRADDDQEEMIIVELAHVAYARGLWSSLSEGVLIGRAFDVELRVNDGGKAAVIGLDRALERFLSQRRVAAQAQIDAQIGEMREKAHVIEGLLVAVDSLETLTKVLQDSSDTDDSVWRLMHIASPELQARVTTHHGVFPETLRATADVALHRVRRWQSELFANLHSYEPGFSKPQALAIVSVVGGPSAINRSSRVQECFELMQDYEKLRSPPGYQGAVRNRVWVQLIRLLDRYKPARRTMDANRAKSKVDSW